MAWHRSDQRSDINIWQQPWPAESSGSVLVLPQRCWVQTWPGHGLHGNDSPRPRRRRSGWSLCLGQSLSSRRTNLWPRLQNSPATWRQTLRSHPDPKHTHKQCRSDSFQRSPVGVAVRSVNLRSEDPCCSPCTSRRRRRRCREPPWSRGRRRRRWWRRTRPRRSSRQPGRDAPCSHPYRWGHQNTPGGVWEGKRKEDFNIDLYIYCYSSTSQRGRPLRTEQVLKRWKSLEVWSCWELQLRESRVSLFR